MVIEMVKHNTYLAISYTDIGDMILKTDKNFHKLMRDLRQTNEVKELAIDSPYFLLEDTLHYLYGVMKAKNRKY